MKRLAILLALFCLAPAHAELPYAEHGWSKEEAANHLLSRFTFGPRPGEAAEVARLGLENWLDQQLQGDLPEPTLSVKLRSLPPAYSLDNKEMLALYPPPPALRKMARDAGLMNEETKRPDRQAMQQLLRQKGLRPYREIGITLFAQKLLHARHAENNLREVLTDFWYNHFNVALSNNRARSFILSYERDALRPNSLGNFRDLLGATAKHPAMLLYLDNANSTAAKSAATTADSNMDTLYLNDKQRERLKKRLQKRKKGLNENYARELLELHTLGVDGGYTQNDVTEVARAFTGWTTMGGRKPKMNPRRQQMAQAMGAKTDGDFIFAAQLHDAGSKTILNKRFPSGGGLEEGEQVLDVLSNHPSTARHIAQKLAVRFISDKPEQRDVDDIARAFQRSNGDIKQTIKAIALSQGFWAKSNRQAKVKTPFELVVSANRALDGELSPSRQLYGWMAKMGQPLYNYQAPTGFPDQADFWVSSATVLNRVNFALQAAQGKVPGFIYEPGTKTDVQAALRLLLPHKNTAETEQNVRALLADSRDLELEPVRKFEARPNLGGRLNQQPPLRLRLKPNQKENATLTGLILGTPEFQRR